MGCQEFVYLLICWISKEDDFIVQHVGWNSEHFVPRFRLIDVEEFDFQFGVLFIQSLGGVHSIGARSAVIADENNEASCLHVDQASAD